MDKIAKSLQKNLIENSYRLLSLANITVNKVALPTVQKASTLFQEDEASYRLVNSLKKNLKERIGLDHTRVVAPLESLGDYLDQSVKETESKLKQEYGVNTDQWLLSLDNLQVLGQIANLLDMTFKEVRQVSKYNIIRYLNAWTVLQRLYLSSYDKNVERYTGEFDFQNDDPKLSELKHAHRDCLYYSSGKLFYYMNSEGKTIKREGKSTNSSEDFIFHTKIAESDVLHSFWETKPYKPAYVITRDQLKKGIILGIRGTHHWTDAVTDLDFHYLRFSIMKEANSDRLFLKFHYNEEYQEYLKKRIGDDTREFNGGMVQPLTGNEVVIETGYAHAGVLVSAISAYREITPKLEEIFANHDDYNLSITGHSLGGGMATIMVLLYLVHPLKAIRDKIDQKLRGYNYGGAAVLSPDFDKYLKNSMKSVVNGDDLIPRLGYGSVKDLCNVILAFDEINARNPSVLSDVLKLDLNQIDFKSNMGPQNVQLDRYKSLYRKFKQDHMDSLKLPPMGRVFHMQDFRLQPVKRNGHSYEYVMREIEPKEYFDEIIFSKQFIKHHFPDQYEQGLLSNKLLYQRYVDETVGQANISSTLREVRDYFS